MRSLVYGSNTYIQVLKKTVVYSGADIESFVKETIETAFVLDDKSVTTDKLLQTIHEQVKKFAESIPQVAASLHTINEDGNSFFMTI